MNNENNGRNKKILMIMIILLLIIVILSIILIKNPFDKDNNVDKNDNNDSEITDVKETKMTDEISIDYLKNAVFILENLDLGASNYATDVGNFDENGEYTYKSNYYKDSFNKEIYSYDNIDISNINKKSATLAFVVASYKSEVEKQNKNITDYKIYVDDILPLYQSIFGFKDISKENINSLVSNDLFNYDASNSSFIRHDKGIGTQFEGGDSITYIYDITESENNAYVYVAYAAAFVYSAPAENCSEDVAICLQSRYYTDYDMTKEYTKEVKDSLINETNYQDFDKYKYTFEKNEDGTYKFVSMVKLGS